jgi:hypothetical protein
MKEDPAPGEAVGDPTAQRRPDRGRGDDRNAIQRKGRGPFRRRKCIDQDGLFDGSETTAANALQDTEDHQEVQRRSNTAEKGGHREEGDADHVVALAPEDAAQPRAHRQHDRIRNQVRSQDPGRLVEASPQATGNVRQRDVGDGGVQQLHERRQRDRQRHCPGVHGPRRRRSRNCIEIRGRCGHLHLSPEIKRCPTRPIGRSIVRPSIELPFTNGRARTATRNLSRSRISSWRRWISRRWAT